MESFDIFISHASEDKNTVARPVAEALTSFGVRVWYDEFTLKLGDSLSRSIDKGLAQSTFGLVILSPSFFAKNWPDYELRGLNAKEIAGEKVILPIWHEVDSKEVTKFSPTLADKFAVKTDNLTPTEIAVQIIEVVRPDILERIHKKLAFIELQRNAVVERVEFNKIKSLMFSPPKHDRLPTVLIGRVRLIRAAFLDVYYHSMEFWIEGFKRDAHPTREIAWWEHAAACYIEFVAKRNLSKTKRRTLFIVLLALAHGAKRSELSKYLLVLPDNTYEQLQLLWQNDSPLWDSDEAFPKAHKVPEGWAEFISSIDKDDFSP